MTIPIQLASEVGVGELLSAAEVEALAQANVIHLQVVLVMPALRYVEDQVIVRGAAARHNLRDYSLVQLHLLLHFRLPGRFPLILVSIKDR